MDSKTRKKELEIVRDYKTRAKTEKENGWKCTIETMFDCTEIIIENPEYPDDRYHFRYDEAERMIAEIPEWVAVEMNPEDYFLAQLVNW